MSMAADRYAIQFSRRRFVQGASLARPGGNVTGLAVAPPELISQKQVELLKEVVPGLSRVGVLWDSKQSRPVPAGPVRGDRAGSRAPASAARSTGRRGS